MWKTAAILAALFLGLYFQQRNFPKEGKIIQTYAGAVKGIVSVSRSGREFFEWLGIPYAKPPLGRLRFASPEPLDKWEGTLDSSQYGPMCAQVEFIVTNWFLGKEDCLSLNVHVPKLQESRDLLPVMIYIHGGGYAAQGSYMFRSNYFMDEDVILVTLNYRLGVFGFLNTGDEVVRGNMGLKDQVLAMKWVKKNIGFFGGDSTKITIFGESAGGASVNYQLLSPASKGLFQRAISQSGASNSAWSYESTAVAKQRTEKLANEISCPTNKTSDLVNCLREKSTDELLSVSAKEATTVYWLNPNLDGQLFKPSLEAVNDSEAFLVQPPLQILAEGKAERVPSITGFVSDEEMITTASFDRDPGRIDLYKTKWAENTLRAFGVPIDAPNATKFAKEIRKFYFTSNVSLNREEELSQYGTMFGDASMYFPIIYTASVQRAFSPTYLYQFSRRGGFSAFKLLGAWNDYSMPRAIKYLFERTLAKWRYGSGPTETGVCHGDDVYYFFPVPPFLAFLTETADDYEISKDLVRLWTSFAHNKPLNFRGLELLPLHPSKPLECYDVNETPAIIDEPFKERMLFLKSLNLSSYYA